MTGLSRTRIVSALGIIEIFAWGSSYYLPAVLAAPIAADTGWRADAIAAGVSVGLLVSGLAAPRVGRLIEASGGRRVLAGGMALIAAGLVVLGSAQTLAMYLAAWALIGLGMSAGLYDAAFSTLGRLFGHDARAAITQLTLWGGFASTVCWPISAALVEAVGWRGTCFAYAALHVALTLPLSLAALPRTPPPLPALQAAASGGASHARAPGLLDPRFAAIVAAGVALTLLSTIWSMHLMTILTAQGYALAAAIGLGTLIGPAQVGGRILEMLGRGRHHPIWTMAVCTTMVFASFLGLSLGAPAAVAVVCYGAGHGLWSIARGALPLSLFGPGTYARTMGRLVMPMLIAGAAAPTIGAFLLSAGGPQTTLSALAALAVIPCVATLVLFASMRRPVAAPRG